MINKAARSTSLPFAADVVKPGAAFLRAVGDHTLKTLLQAAENMQIPQGAQRVAIVDIPRGGLPTSNAATNFLSGYCRGADVRRFTSNIKDNDATSQTLLPPDMVAWQPDMVVVSDGIIASGGSIIRHLEAVKATGLDGAQVMVLCNVLAQQGQDALMQSAAEQGIGNRFTLVSGMQLTTEQSTWMTFDGGKRVLFVGYNPDTGLDMKIPDFGDFTVSAGPQSAL